MARPKIVHVYKDMYPPVEGGIERTIYHLTRTMSDEFDMEVIVASTSASASEQGAQREIETTNGRGVKITEVPSWGRIWSTPMAPGFAPAMRACNADLFHFHVPHPTGEAAYVLSGLKTPAVATYHGDAVRQKLALTVYRPFLVNFLKKMKCVMPTSLRYQNTSPILEGVADLCRVVPLGFPLEDYDADDAICAKATEHREQWGNYVFFIGCLRYYKGLRYLIEAARELPETHIVIAGSGEEEPTLRKQVEAAGLTGRVHFLGRVSHSEAVALFRGARAFCLPACERSEAYGLCQIEAMACGLPIVSTRLDTGVPEVNQDGESGLTVPPKDSAALAEALGKILNDDDLARRLGESGRQRAEEHYTARAMSEKVGVIYREALGQG